MKIFILALLCVEFALATSVPRAKRQIVQYNTNGNNNFVNSRGCSYNNDTVYENGVPRPATEDEKRQVQVYQDEWKQWNIDFNDYMKSQFPPGFPFNKDPVPTRDSPKAPVFPCFCSPAICAGQKNN